MKFKTLALFCLTLLSQEVLSQEDIGCTTGNPYYAGIGYSFRDLAFKNNIGKLQLEKRSRGVQALLGYRHGDNFGIELSGSQAGKRAINSNFVKSYHLVLDAIGFYAISDYAEVLGGLGIGVSKLSFNTASFKNFKKSNVSSRAIAGIQLNVTDSVKLRLSSSAEGFGKIKNAGPYRYKAILSYGLGLLYSF